MIGSILAALFIFLLPGLTLVNALFPRKGELNEELDLLYRFTYGLGLSVVIVILIGMLLGDVLTSMTGQGYFVGINIWLALVAVTVSFFLLGWYRGAYSWLRYIHPTLDRSEEAEEGPRGDDEREEVKKLQELWKEQSLLKKKIKKTEKKMEAGSKEMREHYEEKKEELQERLEEVEKRLKELEKEREEKF
ncbi:MAG: DUF1616 domain-containing protein [Candidatus Thermoplasmatota archaeon]|nr:DUF1616 domain-containing protein [Candidatus Thermoplasmatota archaeon]